MLKSRLAALAVIGLGVLSAPFASAEEFVIPPEVLEAFPIPEDAPAKHAAIQGPFAVKMYAEESLASFTLFAPDDPQSWTEPLPVVAWGNGGCINSNVPVRNFLTTIASYGFVVIAPGPLEPTEDGATPPDIQKTALDWATAQNAEAGGKYEGKLAADNAAAIGTSCGGLQSYVMASDPRVKTIALLNSGSFPIDPNVPAPPLPEQFLKLREAVPQITKPTFIVVGGEGDVAYPNGTADFELLTAPAVLGDIKTGHLGTYWQETGGWMAEATAAWLAWQLRGEQQYADYFKGEACTLCASGDWVIKTKNLD